MDEQNTRKKSARRRKVQHLNNQLLQEGSVSRYWGKGRQSHGTGMGRGCLEASFAHSEVQGLFHSNGTVLNQGKVRKPYPVSTPVSSCTSPWSRMEQTEACMGFLARTQLPWHGGNFLKSGRGVVIKI